MTQKIYSLGILQRHPTQFDGPFFRQLAAHPAVELTVYYWNSNCINSIYDPELNRKCGWDHDILSGYHYSILPTNWIERLKILFQISKAHDLLIISGYTSYVPLLTILFCKFNHAFIGLRSDNTFLHRKNNLKWKLKDFIIPRIYKLFNIGFPVGSLAQLYMLTYGFEENQLFLFPYAVDNSWLSQLCDKYRKHRKEIRFDLGIPDDAFVILGIMKFIPRENPMGLLRLFKRLLNSETNVYLIMVGDGSQRGEIESYIKLHHLEKRVILAGYQPYSLLPKFFAISEVFVHPALYEPWGCSVNEAMACELPVIAASTVGASYDLIKNGINGYIYDAESEDDLCFFLQKLAKLDKESLQLMGQQSKEIITKWSFNTSIKEIIRALKSLEKL